METIFLSAKDVSKRQKSEKEETIDVLSEFMESMKIKEQETVPTIHEMYKSLGKYTFNKGDFSTKVLKRFCFNKSLFNRNIFQVFLTSGL
jgi:hypothetical protein